MDVEMCDLVIRFKKEAHFSGIIQNLKQKTIKAFYGGTFS
jgi:hypothetical protein